MASGMETPTTKRKNGKIMSVGVKPCHAACRRGAYTARHVPGLFTSTIAATVSPRSASTDSRRASASTGVTRWSGRHPPSGWRP